MKCDYEKARNYWGHKKGVTPEIYGVAGIGGAGLTEIVYRHHEELRHLLRIVPFEEKDSVLELGCGNGRWVTSIAPLVENYVAVDFSKQMLDISRDRARRLGLTNITFCEAEAQHYSPSMNFDTVYLSGVSQYLHDEDLKKLLQRLLSHMPPDGVVVDRSTIHRRCSSSSTQPDYFSIYRTTKDLISIFESAGLENFYQRQSYAFLSFPRTIQRILNASRTANLVAALAPLSFVVLRFCAHMNRALFEHKGELVDYSHDFFLFRKTE